MSVSVERLRAAWRRGQDSTAAEGTTDTGYNRAGTKQVAARFPQDSRDLVSF
jgi:hypothetical protein